MNGLGGHGPSSHRPCGHGHGGHGLGGHQSATGTESNESGSAVIEFLLLAFMFLIPLVYLILAVFEVQAAAFAAEGAARDAGRIMVASRSEAQGRTAAQYAAELAFADSGLRSEPRVAITCSAAPCLTGGAALRTVVETEVPLPLIPLGIIDAIGAKIPVKGTAIHTVDLFVVHK